MRDSRSSSANAMAKSSGPVCSGTRGTRDGTAQPSKRLVIAFSQAQSSSGAMRCSTHFSPIRLEATVRRATPSAIRARA